MTKPLLWRGGNDSLLALYGEERYSDIWTYNQAWTGAVRQWESGDHEGASEFFGRLRQEMLQIHINLYPEDKLWRNN